jgi:hypothetical protein
MAGNYSVGKIKEKSCCKISLTHKQKAKPLVTEARSQCKAEDKQSCRESPEKLGAVCFLFDGDECNCQRLVKELMRNICHSHNQIKREIQIKTNKRCGLNTSNKN